MESPSRPRADRDLLETEVKRILTDRDTETCEWELLGGLCFYMNKKYLGIVSTNAAGGDTREILWGVHYPHEIAFLIERSEIVSVPNNVTRGPRV